MSRYDPSKHPVNIQRRIEHIRDDAWIRAFLARTRAGQVATRWEHQPFITPTLFWYDEARHALWFHSNGAGRLRANAERHGEACFSAFEMGKLLPANVALEFSVQYAGVVAFGSVQLAQTREEKEHGLNGLLRKYFAALTPGEDYRAITERELARTSVYVLQIASWSGKENWPERADQSADWPPLAEKWFDYAW